MNKVAGLIIGGFLGYIAGYFVVFVQLELAGLPPVAQGIGKMAAALAPDAILFMAIGGVVGLIIGWFADKEQGFLYKQHPPKLTKNAQQSLKEPLNNSGIEMEAFQIQLMGMS